MSALGQYFCTYAYEQNDITVTIFISSHHYISLHILPYFAVQTLENLIFFPSLLMFTQKSPPPPQTFEDSNLDGEI